MDPETKNFMTSRDVVFDEASSFHITQKFSIKTMEEDDDLLLNKEDLTNTQPVPPNGASSSS